MIRVLIAEDELPLLRGIKNLIEQIDEDFCVVFCAKNGREAVDYLSEHDVDVIFTDINMPVLDGFGVLGQLSEQHKEIPTVVISGYDKFEYARKAIGFGVRNYLLKPVDRNELAVLMQTLKDEIIHRSYMQKREALAQLLYNNDALYAESVDWGQLQLLCLCVGNYRSADEADEQSEYDFDKGNKLVAFLRRVALQQGGQAWCFWGVTAGETIAILENVPQFDATVLLDFFTSQNATVPITIVTGTVQTQPYNISQEIRELRNRLKHGCVYRKSSVVTKSRQPMIPPVELATLQTVLQKKQDSVFMQLLHQMLGYCAEQCVTQYDLEHVLERVFSLMQSELGDWDSRSVHDIVRNLVRNAQDYDELETGLQEIIVDVFHNNFFDTNNKESLMQSVEHYILKNIAEPLTTKELSRHFGLVPPYLSSLFKAYKGLSPAQYIQNIRIESAKQMLLECPQMMIKDIAETLGYSNALYFSKTFYKNTGMYPSEYKQSNKL